MRPSKFEPNRELVTFLRIDKSGRVPYSEITVLENPPTRSA